MKKLLFTLLCCIIIYTSFSQTAASYSFSTSTSPFVSIATTGTLASISGDDFTQQNIQIGFTFNFCGSNYTFFSANSNGFISLANYIGFTATGTNSLSELANIANGQGMICPFWDDLDCTGRAGYYQTTGTSPNRIFTFEWNNAALYGGLSGPTNDSLTFQLKLYEGTNVIKFFYNNRTNPALTATIGIMNSTLDYQTLNNSTSSPAPSATTFYTTISILPDSGQVYIWSPVPLGITSEINSKDHINIFPNPTEDILHIDLAEGSSKSITIESMDGKILIEKLFDNRFPDIYVNQLAQGIYILRVVGDNRDETLRFVKN